MIKRIFVIGPPGSGKTTQAKILAEKLSLPHIYMGEVLREAVKAGLDGRIRTPLGKGGLVDDELILKLFMERIGRDDCRDGFIADGNPRTLYQARKMEECSPPDKVVFVGTSLAEAKRRLLKRGRADDTEETITHRFQVFAKQTEPILDFYRRRGGLIEVDGDSAIEEVAQEIEASLKGGDRD